jgi:hypothetical protein
VKLIIHILFFSFFTLTFCPAVQLATLACVRSCEPTECKTAERKKISDEDCCPMQMCNSCQCMYCCFACPLTSEKIEIKVFETELTKTTAEKSFILAGYTDDLWQPPKTVC